MFVTSWVIYTTDIQNGAGVSFLPVEFTTETEANTYLGLFAPEGPIDLLYNTVSMVRWVE